MLFGQLNAEGVFPAGGNPRDEKLRDVADGYLEEMFMGDSRRWNTQKREKQEASIKTKEGARES